jgi:hypothetical protein
MRIFSGAGTLLILEAPATPKVSISVVNVSILGDFGI